MSAVTNPIPANLFAYAITYRASLRWRKGTVVRFGATPSDASAGMGLEPDEIVSCEHLGSAREYVAAQAVQA